MNLLKQTALILGLTALSLGGWTIYRDWRNRISIIFAFLCLLISVWAISFVTYATLGGRLPHDVHIFCNVWIAPVVITLLSKIFFKKTNRFSQCLQFVSAIGALFLGAMIALSLSRGFAITAFINFWPSFILIQYFYILGQDLIFKGPLNTDYISQSKKIIFYLGLGLSLALCTFDRVPALGYIIPALGNLLLTIYLIFANQIIIPQKIFRLEALLSRFFAILTLALIITGFFALLYSYISETFPLFLLNSFLISFAVLMLWNPLVTFFRYMTRELSRSETSARLEKLGVLKDAISVATDLENLKTLLTSAFRLWLKDAEVTLVFDQAESKLPPKVLEYFEYLRDRKIALILHRGIIDAELEQALTSDRRRMLRRILKFLDNHQTDLIFPVIYSEKVIALLLLKAEINGDEWNLSFGRYNKLGELVADLGPTLIRLTQIEEAKERDRLVLMGEMAAGLAHEVRNPLGAIRSAAELMGEASGPWAKVIQEEVGRLNRLVSQFLDFAYDPKDEQEQLNLNEIMLTSIENIKFSIPNEVKLELLTEETSVLVKAVPDHLQQVLFKLVQNAVKAVEGMIMPQIKIRVFETGFEVTDNGMGMDEETLHKMFQPFFTSFRDGTGLGLSICQKLVHFNSGKISAVSHAGIGTTVSVTFSKDQSGAAQS